ncbi:MAG TPA: M14 family metallopeptidase, partial [candidate division Zixibacteria bacterium]|nr:M14 family metallopeptidase [candidate division Zixibacteria bacterium]
MKVKAGVITLFALLALAAAASASVGGASPIYSPDARIDTVPFYPGGTYDPSVPKPTDFAASPIGQWPIRYTELSAFVHAIARASNRVHLETCGRTFEDRDLFSVFISSPENIKNLENIRSQTNKVASAGSFKTDAELNAAIKDLPAVAWLGFSIHGDEISGTDAATQLIYQLAAGTDSATMDLLDKVIIIIDPTENPDGRERYLSMLQTYRGYVPNYDRFSLQHRGVWPWGRGNHYLFDLNRDLIVVTQPETGGKLATILQWHPQLVVDAHEMEPSGTFLFSPPREPINYNTPSNVLKWWPRFAQQQGQALDSHGWPYYTGEWNDQWFPGYTSAWPSFFGAVGILYEQAGVDGSMVRQNDDYVLSYHEAINHHFTSALTNLRTLADNRVEIMHDYAKARQEIVSKGKKSGLSFVIVPGEDQIKLNRCLNGLLQQGIQVEQATSAFTVASAMNILHEQVKSISCPIGSYIVRTSQEQGALAKAALEFDAHLKPDFLEDERKEIEKYGDTKMYEVSAWSVLMGYDVDAYQTTSPITVTTEAVSSVPKVAGSLVSPDAQYGFVVNMEGEATYKLLNKLFEKRLIVYASEKPFTLDNRSFNAGSLVLRKRGNPDNLAASLSDLADEVGINIYGTDTGMPTEGSYFGAPTFQLLERPSVGILAGNPVDYTDFGSIWFAIDRQLEMPQSLISASSLPYTRLSEYNVIVIPDTWGGSIGRVIGKGGTERLKKWVADGGTLICIGSSAAWAADSATGL